jgi:hypothetical protein
MAASKQKDYLDLTDAAFDRFFKLMNQYVNQKCTGTSPAWTHIPQDARAAFQNAYADWYTAYSNTFNPHTPVQTNAKNEARKTAEHAVRAFVNAYLRYHPAVTDDDRIAMSLHIPDTTKTTIPVPDTRALITDLKPLGAFRVEVRFQNEATPHTRAIPYGCNGCLLNFAVSAEKILDYELLKEDKLMTSNPWVLQLTPEAEAKFLSCAARWQNNKGELGPWSEVMHIAVS